MKSSKQIWILLVVVLVVLGAYQQGKLNADSAVAPAKIGVVNVTRVLESCQKKIQFDERMKAEHEEMQNLLDRMKDGLEDIQANLKLRTPGSEDYLKLRQEMMERRALLEARGAFFESKVDSEIQRLSEVLYQDLLKITEEVAKSKGLDMIIADQSLELPARNLNDFVLTIRTKKVLYHSAQYDLTDEVLAALDKKE